MWTPSNCQSETVPVNPVLSSHHQRQCSFRVSCDEGQLSLPWASGCNARCAEEDAGCVRSGRLLQLQFPHLLPVCMESPKSRGSWVEFRWLEQLLPVKRWWRWQPELTTQCPSSPCETSEDVADRTVFALTKSDFSSPQKHASFSSGWWLLTGRDSALSDGWDKRRACKHF